MLIAAMNPCPCGYYGDRTRECTCSPTMVSRYQKRIPSSRSGQAPGPLMDRIDIHIEVPRVDAALRAGRQALRRSPGGTLGGDPAAGGSGAGDTAGSFRGQGPDLQRRHGRGRGAGVLWGGWGRTQPPADGDDAIGHERPLIPSHPFALLRTSLKLGSPSPTWGRLALRRVI